MLWHFLKWATFAGVASIILFMPLNGYLGRVSKSIAKDKYKQQDARIKTMREVLTGIRVVKLYGWEKSFIDLIQKLRGKELVNLVKTSLVGTCSSFSVNVASFVVASVSFATFVLIDEKNQLDPNTAFVSLILFDMLSLHLKQIPQIITNLMNLNVSLERIRSFLLREEINSDDVNHEHMKEYSILVENVNLGWSKSEEFLSNISMKVKKGSLVAIVGKVGSGKSSLLAGLLNQMHKLNESGKIRIDGKIALVPQQAWIQNATVKNNILFNTAFNENLYEKVLKSCSLIPDLNKMVNGDNTEIGEKGASTRDFLL